MASNNALRALAERLYNVEKRVQAVGSGGQLAYSSIEDGALQAHNRDGEQTMVIGRQWDGTYTSAVTSGPTPPTPNTAFAVEGVGAATLGWDGTFVAGAILPMDFLRVDLHIGASGFTPDHTNRYGSFTAPTGGSVSITLPYGTYYAKLVCWSQAGVVSAASTQLEFDIFPIAADTDGFAPSSSPAPEVFQGIREMYVRWTPITNADPVWYDVHVSDTLGFTAGPSTLVGSTQASAYTIDALPGAAPMEGEEDTRVLKYDIPYYVRIVARDEDGAAAQSAQAVGGVFRVTGINLMADSVTASNIVAGSLTGELFSATVIYAGTFKTAETGQRVETGIAGIQGYKSDGTLMINFPTDPNQTALIDAEIIARGLTVTNGMTLRATSSVEPDASIKLNLGIAAPVSTPQMSKTYMTRRPDTSSLTAAEKTGSLGTFDLVPTEVSFIEWKTSFNYWVIHQIRPGGTRAWFFDYDGNPWDLGIGTYFTDYTNWEIWSVVDITTSTSGKNGVYRMARWIPSGSNNTFYLMCPQGVGFNRYSRLNGTQPPVVGSNGTDVFIAEVISSTHLSVKYYTPNGDGNNLSAPVTAYESAAGYNANHPLSQVLYDAGAFDTGSGTARYLTASRGYADDNRLVFTSGTNLNSIHPGGTTPPTNTWTQSTKDAESFEAATTNPRCIAWMSDESRFWTYGGDGYLYQHTATKWDPSVTSSTVWARQTFYDSVGTTHETTPGPATSFVWPRRSKIALSLPPLPGAGGADDPNVVKVYMGRGGTQPANSAMWLQGNGTTTLTVETLATSGTNPPTVSTFPNTNPGKIVNEAATLEIKGDGTIKGSQIFVGTTEIVAVPPYWYGYLNAGPTAVAALTLTTITGWVADGSPNSSGITHSSGIFTLPIAGRYQIKCQLWWAPIAGATGMRQGAVVRVSGPTVIQSSTVNSSATTGANAGYPALNLLNKTARFSAGDQVYVRFQHGDSASRAPTGTTSDITFVQIEWLGP